MSALLRSAHGSNFPSSAAFFAGLAIVLFRVQAATAILDAVVIGAFAVTRPAALALFVVARVIVGLFAHLPSSNLPLINLLRPRP